MLSRPLSALLLLSFILPLQLLAATTVERTPSAPERDRGEGPYHRLILRGGTYISGEGAPPLGPVDIVIEKDRIVDIVAVGHPGVPVLPEGRA